MLSKLTHDVRLRSDSTELAKADPIGNTLCCQYILQVRGYLFVY